MEDSPVRESLPFSHRSRLLIDSSSHFLFLAAFFFVIFFFAAFLIVFFFAAFFLAITHLLQANLESTICVFTLLINTQNDRSLRTVDAPVKKMIATVMFFIVQIFVNT
jgi:ABC-type multidrug transport system permease subunit